MKPIKYLLIIITPIIILFSCKTKTPDELLIEEFETYFNKEIVTKMNDPKSYEKINSEIKDTILVADLINIEISTSKNSLDTNIKQLVSYKSMADKLNRKDSKEYMLKIGDTYNVLAKRDSLQIDSLNNVLINTQANEISTIVLVHNFRAKNGFGALVVGKYTFSFNPKEQDLTKRFMLQSDK